MALTALVNALQKEFKQKVVTAQRVADRRYFEVDSSLDNSVDVGKPIMWDNLKHLSQDGYAVVLYDKNLARNDAVRATVVDEINSLRITQAPTSGVKVGPTSYRKIYESIASEYPVIVSGKPL